ncbi:MAG: peptidoglycan DD-metalloendopeptidase family protein [Gemmatimonadota bacterium]|nr:peptidoglycan DD-metalloendopeptidase family protein [Gemmatimonadota bacterium]
MRAALALLALGVGAPLALSAQTPVDRQIRENQARLDSIRRERQDLESQLERLRGRERSFATELLNLERQKVATSRLVNELDRQMSALGSQLDSITLDLLIAQDALAEKRAVGERRLVEVYKRGPLWALQVLLSAANFGDLLSRYKYLYLVSRQDQAIVGEVEELRDRIALERRQLALVQGEVGRNREERSRELSRYQRLELERAQGLRQTRVTAERASERLTALERTERDINNVIAALERRRRDAATAGRATFPATITEASLASLEWPATGPLLYRYGRTTGPGGTVIRRDGIGIGAPVGSEVRAVAGGEVVLAGPVGTYGPSVMVDHGGGFYTLYLYLSSLSVVANQQVTGGTVIGRSGGQGTEEGPHMEFQIRQVPGGSGQPLPLDPQNWLRPRN